MHHLPYTPRMQELAEKWMTNTITEEEKQEFTSWYNQYADSDLELPLAYKGLVQQIKKQSLQQLQQAIAAAPSYSSPGRLPWRSISVAAAVLLLLAGVGILFKTPKSTTTITPAPLAKTTPAADILPGSNKAVLVLEDGQAINLDSAGNGTLTQQGTTRIVKSANGQLRYVTGKGAAASAISYNTLATPKGGQYKLVLPDGSQVWLNAASSIRYPTAFAGTERKVEITGEAYLEITKNTAMPFTVLVNKPGSTGAPMQIEVLGTSFNVNAYHDEAYMHTTLLEGAVKLTSGIHSAVLKPGQQARMQPAGNITHIALADIDQVMAWKNGMFEYKGENLETILREVARWYDVEVVYKGGIPKEQFTGQVPRHTSLAGLIKILNVSGVEMTIENRKLMVNS